MKSIASFSPNVTKNQVLPELQMTSYLETFDNFSAKSVGGLKLPKWRVACCLDRRKMVDIVILHKGIHFINSAGLQLLFFIGSNTKDKRKGASDRPKQWTG